MAEEAPDNSPKTEETARSVFAVTDAQIRNMIYTVRGEQVMLDSDLAELYGVETKVLNQAVTRNMRRFPERFCFRLTKREQANLRSQIVTLHSDQGKQDGWWRYPPRVFTEQGVSMLSAVLRSDTAIEVSIKIMDAFVEMRHFIADNAHMFEQIRSVEQRQIETSAQLAEYQKSTDERFERVFDYMEAHDEPSQKAFFEGQVYDAFELLVSLVQRAKESIVLIDGYVDMGTLNILAKKAEGVAVSIWTHPKTKLTAKDVETFNAQYPALEVHHTKAFHDRFLILDGTKGYLVGASLKDAGKKSFAVARIEDQSTIDDVLGHLTGPEPITTEELDRRFDAGEDITPYLDLSTMRRPNQERLAARAYKAPFNEDGVPVLPADWDDGGDDGDGKPSTE